jgi:hypothetical protein
MGYGINVPGAFEHLLANVRGATALFPDMLLVEEFVGGRGGVCEKIVSLKMIAPDGKQRATFSIRQISAELGLNQRVPFSAIKTYRDKGDCGTMAMKFRENQLFFACPLGNKIS